jgi:hypothetical protein
VQNASTCAVSRVGSPFTPERPFGPGQAPALRGLAISVRAEGVAGAEEEAETDGVGDGGEAGAEHAAASMSVVAASRCPARRRHPSITPEPPSKSPFAPFCQVSEAVLTVAAARVRLFSGRVILTERTT